MAEGEQKIRLYGTDWLNNDELGRLIAGVARRDKGVAQKLFPAITPLLTAFYEGQHQAGRVRHESIVVLIQEALLLIHKSSIHFESSLPTRAWLIDIARRVLVTHLQAIEDSVPLVVVPELPAVSKCLAPKAV